MDGMLTIFEIKDKDPKRDIKDLQQLEPSQEILSDKNAVDQLQVDEEQL